MKHVIQIAVLTALAAVLSQAQPVPFAKQPDPAGLGSAVGAAPPTEKEENDLKRITKETDPVNRMNMVDTFARSYPNSSLLPVAYAAAGDAAVVEKKTTQARFYYEKSIQLNPKIDYPHIMLADIIMNEVKDDSPTKEEEIARARALAERGLMLIDDRKQGNQPQEGFLTMKKNDQAKAHEVLGWVFVKSDVGKAGSEFLLAAEVAQSPNPANLLRAGVLLNAAGQFDRATVALTRFIDFPGLAEEYKVRGRTEIQNGQKRRKELEEKEKAQQK